jgi:hypothetical protein
MRLQVSSTRPAPHNGLLSKAARKVRVPNSWVGLAILIVVLQKIKAQQIEGIYEHSSRGKDAEHSPFLCDNVSYAAIIHFIFLASRAFRAKSPSSCETTR